MIQRARYTGVETSGYLPGRYNKQLAQETGSGEPTDMDKVEQNSDVQGTEVGLTKSTEKK